MVTGLAVIAVATLANLQVMELARTTFAMARNGMLPPVLTPVSASGTPRRALALSVICMIAIIFAADLAKGPLYEILLNLYAPMVMVVFFLLSVSAIRLRRTEPDLYRPWKMPLFPFPAILSAALNLLLLGFFLVSDWKTGIWSALMLALAGPIYLIGRGRWRDEATDSHLIIVMAALVAATHGRFRLEPEPLEPRNDGWPPQGRP